MTQGFGGVNSRLNDVAFGKTEHHGRSLFLH